MAVTTPQPSAAQTATREIFMSEALREAIDEEMTRDPTVFVVGEEVGVWGGAYAVTQGLLEKWGPDRIVDTPIAEAAIAGLGIGAALTGSRPVAEFMYSDFMGIAMDQIVNQAAKNRYMFGGKAKLPLTYRRPLAPAPATPPSTPRALRPGLPTYRASKSLPPQRPTTPRDCSNRPSARTTWW